MKKISPRASWPMSKLSNERNCKQIFECGFKNLPSISQIRASRATSSLKQKNLRKAHLSNDTKHKILFFKCPTVHDYIDKALSLQHMGLLVLPTVEQNFEKSNLKRRKSWKERKRIAFWIFYFHDRQSRPK